MLVSKFLEMRAYEKYVLIVFPNLISPIESQEEFLFEMTSNFKQIKSLMNSISTKLFKAWFRNSWTNPPRKIEWVQGQNLLAISIYLKAKLLNTNSLFLNKKEKKLQN